MRPTPRNLLHTTCRPARRAVVTSFLAIVALSIPACKEKPQPAQPATRRSTPTVAPTVASLVPGATDLIVGMGASDHLLAVSNYDVDRDGVRGLPRVGDYQNLDWEQLTVLKPDVLVVFMAPDRMPEALRQRAESLSMRLVNVRIERVDEIYAELTKLGDLLNEQPKAQAASEKLRTRLDSVRKRAENKPRPRTLVVREPAGDGAVGGQSFIDDVLQIAGGTNVLTTPGWPTLDRETLIAGQPEVIFHLLPDASPQVVAEAKRLWTELPQLPAVKNDRVYILTEWYALQPGLHIADLAERFVERLHPD